jgi:hypothetical protein
MAWEEGDGIQYCSMRGYPVRMWGDVLMGRLCAAPAPACLLVAPRRPKALGEDCSSACLGGEALPLALPPTLPLPLLPWRMWRLEGDPEAEASRDPPSPAARGMLLSLSSPTDSAMPCHKKTAGHRSTSAERVLDCGEGRRGPSVHPPRILHFHQRITY